MLKKIDGHKDISRLIREVFATDEDLYTRRYHGDDKTLSGIVSYTMSALFDDSSMSDVDVYAYGDRYGFFAVNENLRLLRSFGIKKQHRDKKDLFWQSVREVLGNAFMACVWEENGRATRFFEQQGAVLFNSMNGGVGYTFNLN